MLNLPSAGKLFIPVHRTGYSSFEDFIKKGLEKFGSQKVMVFEGLLKELIYF
jgi:hypothetical protein